MDFSSFRRFIYRIEPKPGGGFIATCKDSTLPPIEGATRNEVQQKIQERITATLGEQIPALKSALETSGIKLHYHIEPKPGGGFIVHHGDADPAHIEGSTLEHIESLIESKFFSALIDRLPVDLHQQITEKLSSGGLDITVDGQVSVNTKSGSIFTPEFKKEVTQLITENIASGSEQNAHSVDQPFRGVPHFSPPLGEVGSTTSDSPITRYDSDSPVKYEKSSFRNFLRLLLAVAIVAAMIYVFLHRH
jgi:hypothetical protein